MRLLRFGTRPRLVAFWRCMLTRVGHTVAARRADSTTVQEERRQINDAEVGSPPERETTLLLLLLFPPLFLRLLARPPQPVRWTQWGLTQGLPHAKRT